MTRLTSGDAALYQSQKQCYISGKMFCYDKKQEKRFKLYKKVKVPHEIPVKIQNGSKYDYHLIIKKLAEECRGEEFQCLGENTHKCITFPVPIKKEHDNDSGETITYKIKFIDSCRFMPSKLLSLADNLSEINNKDFKTCMERKNISSEFNGL